MELKIDGQICDLKAGSIAVPGYDAARLADPEACREGRSLKIPIPATPRNDALVGFACDPHAAGGFNDALHTAELSAEGSALIGGTVRLLAASGEGYTLEIRDGGAGWAENAARRMFSRLGVAWDNVVTPTAIVESWTDDSPVKFFPIHRDEYRRQNSSSDLLPAERLLSVEDYHPFLHVATLVGQIFREADYEVKSRFLIKFFQASTRFHMSGASRDTTAAAGRAPGGGWFSDGAGWRTNWGGFRPTPRPSPIPWATSTTRPRPRASTPTARRSTGFSTTATVSRRTTARSSSRRRRRSAFVITA